MQNDKVFNILSIDGGGIKGIYSLMILKALEERYGPLLDHFKMICGTSTGGLIALGIASGRRINEILDFYVNNGNKIFPSSNKASRVLRSIKQLLITEKYNNNTLKRLLIDFFDNLRMENSKCHLCIPATNIYSAKGVVFKTPHSEEYYRDRNISFVDVGMATTAAPTFFPIINIKDKFEGLVDGGLWANNPSLIGAVEAMTHFVGDDKPFDKFNILSISNLSSHESAIPFFVKHSSIFSWNKNLISLIMSTSGNAMDNILQIANRNRLFVLGDYIRIEDPKKIDSKVSKLLKLDRADIKSINILQELGRSQADYVINDKRIKQLFVR